MGADVEKRRAKRDSKRQHILTKSVMHILTKSVMHILTKSVMRVDELLHEISRPGPTRLRS